VSLPRSCSHWSSVAELADRAGGFGDLVVQRHEQIRDHLVRAQLAQPRRCHSRTEPSPSDMQRRSALTASALGLDQRASGFETQLRVAMEGDGAQGLDDDSARCSQGSHGLDRQVRRQTVVQKLLDRSDQRRGTGPWSRAADSAERIASGLRL